MVGPLAALAIIIGEVVVFALGVRRLADALRKPGGTPQPIVVIALTVVTLGLSWWLGSKVPWQGPIAKMVGLPIPVLGRETSDGVERVFALPFSGVVAVVNTGFWFGVLTWGLLGLWERRRAARARGGDSQEE